MIVALRMMNVCFFLFAAINFSGAAEAKEKIGRAVSLDYCSDQFLLALADKDQIYALSPDAKESHSFYADRAVGIRQFGATLEEILISKTDLVVRYWGGWDFLSLLEKTNIPVVSPLYGNGSETLYKNLNLVGRALGQEVRAAEMIKNHKIRYATLKGKAASNLRVAYITPSGITAGTGTFVDDLLRFAGFKTVSSELGIKGWQPFPLEAMVYNPPDIIIGSFFDLPNPRIASWSIIRHERIREMMREIPTIIVPGRYLSCNGIFTLEAAEYIRERIVK